MKYLIINRVTNEVHLGPIDWNAKFIQAVLRDDLDNDEIEIRPDDVDRIPYEIHEDVWAFAITSEVREEYNEIIERPEGPFWSIVEADRGNFSATMTYTKVDLPLEVAKSLVKNRISRERKIRERTTVFTMEVQGTQVTIESDRENRNAYYQKYLTIDDSTDEVVRDKWRFREGWLALSKDDLRLIIRAIDDHVQEQFDWEEALDKKIDEAKDLTELLETYNTEVKDEIDDRPGRIIPRDAVSREGR